jgi:hypothetical protein
MADGDGLTTAVKCGYRENFETLFDTFEFVDHGEEIRHRATPLDSPPLRKRTIGNPVVTKLLVSANRP